LILGSTSDIARAIAHHYAKKGVRLLLAARNKVELEKDQKDLTIRYEIEEHTYSFDARNISEHQNFLNQLSYKADLVFCVFGFLANQKDSQENWTLEEESLEVNFMGACSILHHVANQMEKAKKGTIVGISSVAGERGRASNYAYGSAKAGFTAYLSGLRNRLYASNVHVLTVKPGYIKTRMTDGMNLPKLLTTTPEKLAEKIGKAVKKKKQHPLCKRKLEVDHAYN